VSRPLALEIAVRQSPQPRVYQRHQLLEGRGISGLPRHKQTRDLRALWHGAGRQDSSPVCALRVDCVGLTATLSGLGRNGSSAGRRPGRAQGGPYETDDCRRAHVRGGESGRFAAATGTFTLRFIDSHDEATATGKFSGSFEGRIDLNR
jgi:hypothetical protein